MWNLHVDEPKRGRQRNEQGLLLDLNDGTGRQPHRERKLGLEIKAFTLIGEWALAREGA